MRCTANVPDVVGAVVVRREPAAVEAARVDDPLAVGAVVVDVADDDGAAGLDRLPQGGQRARRGRGRLGARGPRGLGPVAGADRGRPPPATCAACARLDGAGGAARRGGRGPAAGRDGSTRTVPSAASTTGAAPSSRSRGSSTSRGEVPISDGRGEQAQAEACAPCGSCTQRGERGLVVGAQERLGVPDPHRAEGAGDVVDEELQRLGDRRLRDRRRGSRAPRAPTSRRRSARRTRART